MLSGFDYLLVLLAAMAAGLVNALAGGGTLLSFPMLLAVGVPAVAANVTNTVALCPGYLGATWAQRDDIRGQGPRLLMILPAAIVGGIAGALLVLYTGERLFRQLVPVLILLACALLALQDRVRGWLLARADRRGTTVAESWAALPIGLAAVYGGYFGAGLSVMILAVLGIVFADSLTRLNALKQMISFATNTSAAICFVMSGEVVWPVALVMAVGALVGGALGGRLAGRVQPSTLRTAVVAIGVLIGLSYFFP